MTLMGGKGVNATTEVMQAAEEACATIAPTWPLDRSIAVNPYWMFRERTFAAVAEEMRSLAGSRMAMPMPFYREQWETGSITLDDLTAANAETDEAFSVEELVRALDEDDEPAALPLYSDLLDCRRNADHQVLWREHITTQISQSCASFFDRFQADWGQGRNGSLYGYWLELITTDQGGALLMGDASWLARSRTLPSTAAALLDRAAASFALSSEQLVTWFRVALHRIQGWASWCSFVAWESRLNQREDPRLLVELLAIRIAWEAILLGNEGSAQYLLSDWQNAWKAALHHPASDKHHKAQVWLRAHEISYQRELRATLAESAVPQCPEPEVQAVFCIDVRSEPLRRHLERSHPGYETLGFAGFFGIPMDYQTLGTEIRIPHLPGLFAAGYLATDSTGDERQDSELRERKGKKQAQLSLQSWHQRLPASGFNLVEAEGPLKLLSLWKQTFGSKREASVKAQNSNHQLQIRLHATLDQKLELGERFLRATGLHQRIAPTVLLVGHGAQNTNNPLASALDCGACCGQNGLTNARALSSILNDPAVRSGLRERGVIIPGATVFVAAVHNTTLDTVTLESANRACLPTGSAKQIESVLERACNSAREERAARSGFTEGTSSLLRGLTRRALDWAELRPEWGLVNNACLIVGPRERTRGLDLKARSFLQEYNAEDDPEGSLLAQILGGPMIVSNWINLQYFASCVDPVRFGSGNKTLHNVVGGHIGVFEGNGGDLRIGLARQSVHDGERWRHDPIRLTVVVYANKKHLEAALQVQPMAKELVAGKWLYLFAKEGEKFERVYP